MKEEKKMKIYRKKNGEEEKTRSRKRKWEAKKVKTHTHTQRGRERTQGWKNGRVGGRARSRAVGAQGFQVSYLAPIL